MKIAGQCGYNTNGAAASKTISGQVLGMPLSGGCARHDVARQSVAWRQ